MYDYLSGKKLQLPENDERVMEQRSRVSEEFRKSTTLTMSDYSSIASEHTLLRKKELMKKARSLFVDGKNEDKIGD